MTREEAIALLNEQYETCKRIYDCSADQRKSYPNVPQFMEALGMALTALRPVSREQVEKIYPGCSKCLARGDRNVLNDPGAHDFRLKDSALVYWDEQYGWEGTKVLFCPWCGSPLTDEAVEITMRRLEALNEED